MTIEHSAEFGQGWLVEIEYNTEADGAVVPDDVFPKPRTLHGTFETQEEAVKWMEDYPDGDTDVHEMTAICFNRVRPA